MRHSYHIPALLAIACLTAGASASTLEFPDLILQPGTFDMPFTTTAISTFGSINNQATLSFTLESDGGTYISDLLVSVTDPQATNDIGTLPGAPDDAGFYSGVIQFATASPGSGTYGLTFTNTFATSFPVSLKNIRLKVTPTPEPSTALTMSCAILGLGALRRRTRKPAL